MPDYRLTPAGETSPTVTLYSESMKDIPRRQTHNIERHDTIKGAAPGSGSAGLNPGEIRFDGLWLGASAASIADTFRNDFVDDPTVTRLDVQAIDDSGTFISSRYNGTYRIAEETRVDKSVAHSDRNWRYRILLIED